MTESLNLTFVREQAERLMTSTCTITRADGEPVWDAETGTYTTPPPTVVYQGICKVQDTGRSTGRAEAGEIQAGITDQVLHLPIAGSGGVRRDDVARIDSNPTDPGLVGREFVVQAPHAATAKSARRLPIQAVV